MISKRLLFSLLLTYINLCSSAQKLPIDLTTDQTWPLLVEEQISNNGKYVSYMTGNRTTGISLILQKADNSGKREIPNGQNGIFTEDSKRFVFMKGTDSLGILDLISNHLYYISKVSTFKTPSQGHGEWLVYQSNGSGKATLLNLATGNKKEYDSVTDYFLSGYGNTLLLQIENKTGSTGDFTLRWIDLNSGEEKTIWQGLRQPTNIYLSENGKQTAFFTEETFDQEKCISLNYYSNDMRKSIIKVSDTTLGLNKAYAICPTFIKFSANGEKIFFRLKQKLNLATVSKYGKAINVDIWHYKDENIQSEQIERANNDPNIYATAVINKKNDKVILLQTSDDDPLSCIFSDGGNGEYILVAAKHNIREMNPALAGKTNVYLVSTIDGSRKPLPDASWRYQYSFSPRGNYVIWWNANKRQYFVYDIRENKTNAISANIPDTLYDVRFDKPLPPPPFGIAGWLEDDNSVLIYDRNDIWQTDPKGKNNPVNITNGYGKSNNLVLRYLDLQQNFIEPPGIKSTGQLMLVAFNPQNKDNGFFKLKLGPKNTVSKLTMGPFIYYLPGMGQEEYYSTVPKKSKNANVYLVRRMSASESPNLYVSTDLVNYIPLTSIHPEEKYNWLTTTLVRWKKPDGEASTGILYKPENFDPNKKYPLILYFYERLSNGLNNFISPGLSSGPLTDLIPYLVSNGYLAFVPDIYYKIGAPGEGVYNTVTSVVTHLLSMPYIDSSKIGIQSHSWGGYEVNYLVTHSNIFAAAASAAGVSDFVSSYGGFYGQGSAQFSYEIWQSRIGCTLWEKPGLYIQNSPVFGADKVTTPLLIMHNKNDTQVQWSQGTELFTALRRLNKRVWMLQYDDEGHSVDDPQKKLDYSMRLVQFFNHYLKDLPPPKWMTDGVPARLKGIETGFDADTSGKQP